MLLSLYKIECGTIAHNQLPEHTTTRIQSKHWLNSQYTPHSTRPLCRASHLRAHPAS
jgi:hypothetical protein